MTSNYLSLELARLLPKGRKNYVSSSQSEAAKPSGTNAKLE